MINFKDYAQVIDMDLEQWHIPYVVCKQNDARSRFLKIRLFNRGELVNIDDELTIFSCYFLKGDKKEVYNYMTKEDGYLVVELTSQTLAVAGKVEAELVISQQGSILTSRPFILDVIKTNTMGTGAHESSNEYQGLTGLIGRVEEMIKDLKDLDAITIFTHVINVTPDTAGNTLSFNTFADFREHYSLNVYLSGVRLIEGNDYDIDKANKTITAKGRTFRDKDQLLLQCYKRGKALGDGDNTIEASNVIAKPSILGASNAQNVLTLLNSNIGGNLNRLETTDKGSLIQAINELNAKINNFQNVKLKRYTRVDEMAVPSTTINININEYDPNNSDILDVYMAGVRLVENVGYRLDKNLKTITCLSGEFDKQILLEVTKVE